jgi:TonB-dependent starch-binding outer membrane protein SusC
LELPKLTAMPYKFISALTRIFFLLVCCVQITYGQTRTVTGKVTDEQGNGIPGITVSVKGSGGGTQTNSSGMFTIEAAPNATLVFSGIGFTAQEISASETTANVVLSTSNTSLNEVVVVGYGTARRRDVTGSVVSVKSKDFNRGVQTSPDQLIQGKAAGVMVINNSGQPGGATTVRIRGAASIRSGNSPLFVVDGVPLSGGSGRPGFSGGGIGSTPAANPLNFMNPNDIASIEVLKDASATAIYGSRGANGVILITTKRGITGAPSMDISGGAGVSTIMKRLDVLSGDEYRAALKQYNLTGGDFGGNVDALDAILQKAITQNYNVSVGGGTENGRYRISGGYLNQQGVVRESGLKKYTANVTSNFKLLESRKLGLDFNVLTSHTTEDIAPISNDAGFTGSLIGQALQWNPTHPLRKPNDSLWIDPAVGATTINPLVMLAAWEDRANVSTVLASISPSYKITNELEYKLLYSINRSVGVRRTQVARYLNAEGIENRGAAAISNNEETNQSLTHTLSYNKQVTSGFNLNAVVGYEYLKYDSKGNGSFGLDFADVGLAYYNYLQYSTQSSRGIGSFASPTTELQSFLSRAIMNFRDRYLVTATFRADGSTKFGANNKYGYFPSFAFGWNLHNEDFLRGSTAVSNLKFRASWGRTGNQEFPSGASLNRFVVTNVGTFGQSNFGNEDLRWETSTTSNVGIDFTIIDSKFFGSIDYFNKKSTDVLYEQNIVQPAPGGKLWINLPGYIVNKGVEVSLNAALMASEDVSWNAGVNASFLNNTVKGFRPGEVYETGALHGQGISGTTSQRITNNQPLNTFYLRDFIGIDKATGQANYADGGNTLYYMGSPNPKVLLGFSTDFTFKKFMAIINMNGSFGQYVYNNTANTVLPIGNLGTRNIAKSLIGTSIKEDASNPIAASSRYLEKGDYIKMANATLIYNIGPLGKSLKNTSISLTGQNLFVITNYTGFDPEVNTDKSVGGIPSLGIEYTPYPSARTVLLSINFSL